MFNLSLIHLNWIRWTKKMITKKIAKFKSSIEIQSRVSSSKLILYGWNEFCIVPASSHVEDTKLYYAKELNKMMSISISQKNCI